MSELEKYGNIKGIVKEETFCYIVTDKGLDTATELQNRVPHTIKQFSVKQIKKKKMITPHFNLTQNEEYVIVHIKIPPYQQFGNEDIQIDNNTTYPIY